MTEEREALVLLRYLAKNPAQLRYDAGGWFLAPPVRETDPFMSYDSPLAALRAYKKATVAAKTRARKGDR